jgi:hypothetical protein
MPNGRVGRAVGRVTGLLKADIEHRAVDRLALRDDEPALAIGFGPRVGLVHLGRRIGGGGRVVGVDPSSAMVQQAARRSRRHPIGLAQACPAPTTPAQTQSSTRGFTAQPRTTAAALNWSMPKAPLLANRLRRLAGAPRMATLISSVRRNSSRLPLIGQAVVRP